MNLTLDHNCIIHLDQNSDVGQNLRKIINSNSHQCFVVNIGASEMRAMGVKPEKYELFENLLIRAGIEKLPRLNPMLIWDVVFWDKFIWADDEMIQLASEIDKVLFDKSPIIDISQVGLDSEQGCKWLNRVCDTHTMWAHIHNKNDVFLTADRNFMKKTKLPKLLSLGANLICHPNEFSIH